LAVAFSVAEGVWWGEWLGGSEMSKKRVLVIDAFNVVKVLRELGVSFEDIAALGCHVEGESDQKMTPELISAWYEEAKEADRYHRL
jgi:hypothetical protein